MRVSHWCFHRYAEGRPNIPASGLMPSSIMRLFLKFPIEREAPNNGDGVPPYWFRSWTVSGLVFTRTNPSSEFVLRASNGEATMSDTLESSRGGDVRGVSNVKIEASRALAPSIAVAERRRLES